jgi:hypothetical protein
VRDFRAAADLPSQERRLTAPTKIPALPNEVPMTQAKKPLIERPGHPVVKFAAQFSRDEIYAAALGALLTAAAYWLLGLASGDKPSAGLLAAVLPFVAPICEKPGLVAHYLGEGIGKWRAGAPLLASLRDSLFDGRAFRTVRADTLFHDPSYMTLMGLGTWLLAPDGMLAAGFLSAMSFGGAVLAAAVLEVATSELGYQRKCRWLEKRGFARDSYYETRYLIESDGPSSPAAVLDRLAQEFGLHDRSLVDIEDRYTAGGKFPEYNGREPSVRMRTASATATGSGVYLERANFQVVYSRAFEIGRNDASLFRCFAVRKDKFNLPVGREAGDALALSRYMKEPFEGGPIKFVREVARDPGGIFASVDALREEGAKAFWLEIKIRDDLDLLKRANEFVATHFPVQATTKNKRTLLDQHAEVMRQAA